MEILHTYGYISFCGFFHCILSHQYMLLYEFLVQVPVAYTYIAI